MTKFDQTADQFYRILESTFSDKSLPKKRIQSAKSTRRKPRFRKPIKSNNYVGFAENYAVTDMPTISSAIKQKKKQRQSSIGAKSKGKEPKVISL